MQNNKSIIIESTLSGRGLAIKLDDFKANGYFIQFVYVFLDSYNLCNKRVNARVRKGGHHVPPEDVKRRFFRSLKNFNNIYKPLADKWTLWYNGLERPVKVAIYDEGDSIVYDEAYFDLFKELSK